MTGDVAYVVEVRGNDIFASCSCGHGMMTPNQGLGRATIAAWKTRHQDCPRGYITEHDIAEGAGFAQPRKDSTP